MPRDKIVNPILPGFNPDPSICRAGGDYYIATSTFEWYPGVQIHHSTDLGNWQLVARPLNRPALLNMLGNPDSCGVWAPCLSYSDGRFYLAYTDVKRLDGNFKDTHNYLTWCSTVDGEWADPVYLNSSGFDASLFHDEDGRKWWLNMIWDHRAGRDAFHGIALQEYSPSKKKLIGERKIIFEGSGLGCTEGPHLYRRNGYYYLMTAEGGTGYGHAVTMARSKNIDGPYEVDPAGPVVTSRDDPDWPLQRAGHGDIVSTPAGEDFLVHLVGRPLPGKRTCPMGRETALARLTYTDDGWFRLASGNTLPEPETVPPKLAEAPAIKVVERDDFDGERLNPVYQWLRTPWPDRFMSLSARAGHIRLYGMESPGSLFHQALIARRQTSFRFEASTLVDFEPDDFQQMAGLIVYYNSSKFHYLYISRDDAAGRHLNIMSCNADASRAVTYPLEDRLIGLPDSVPVHLRATGKEDRLTFSWSFDGDAWNDVPRVLDSGLLCDESGTGDGANFTGTFIGLTCNDLTGMRKHADFEFFEYRDL